MPPKRSRPPNPACERGSASLVAAALVALLVAVTAAGAIVGSAVIARHRAQAAADLAALSAAGQVGSGPDAACAVASTVAVAMRTTISACDIDGLDVVVTAESPVELGRWGIHVARGVARAGPSRVR